MASNEKVPRAPSREDFAQMVQDGIRQAGETAALRYDASAFRIVSEGESPHTLNLHNAYREYCAATASSRPAVVRNYVRGWFGSREGVPENFEEVRDKLLPSVRTRIFFEAATLRARVEENRELVFPYRPVGEHFGIGLVYDMPHGMLLLQTRHLADWGQSFEELFRLGVDHLRAMSRDRLQTPAPGVWKAPWRDCYAASRLLLTDRFRHLAVKGDLVALIPNRDTLLLTGSEDEAGLTAALGLIKEALRQPRSFSGSALRLAGEEWQPYLPEKDHPLYAQFKRLSVAALSSAYDEQKDLLERVQARTGQEVFVATYSSAVDSGGKQPHSYCVWTEGLEALLPRTDVVHFIRARPKGQAGPAERLAVASWERVVEVMGQSLESLGTYPERYRARGFPTQEQLGLLAQESD